MAQILPFNMESIEEMSDFIAGQLQEKFKKFGMEMLSDSDRGHKLFASLVEVAIYNFEADLVGRYGEDQRFIEPGERIDPMVDYAHFLEECSAVENELKGNT